jgi:hypothetical protein
MNKDRRNAKRKNFSYYMRVMDDSSRQFIGHLADISPKGFKIDSKDPIMEGRDLRLRFDLTPDISDKDHMTFIAKTKWCRRDSSDPTLYNIGFEIVRISPIDVDVYQRMVEKYGARDSGW